MTVEVQEVLCEPNVVSDGLTDVQADMSKRLMEKWYYELRSSHYYIYELRSELCFCAPMYYYSMDLGKICIPRSDRYSVS